jgi:hypothetical protein
MPFFNLFIAHCYGESFFRSDEDDKLFTSCDACIEEVAVEKFKVRGVDRDDDTWSFATLIFMNRDGIG